MLSAVDSNVISALWSREPIAGRVAALLTDARRSGKLVMCAPVFAELRAYPRATASFVDQFLRDTDIVVAFELGERVWREAASAFATYADQRRRAGGGEPKRLLVDCVVGAHALLESDRPITLDASRYECAFPELPLLSA